MKKNLTTNLANYIILILILTLVSLLTYNIYILFNTLISPKVPPKNSIRVSPLTGENISVNSNNQIIRVDYRSSNINELSFIENSPMIFENYNAIDSSCSYTALFNANNIKLDDSMNVITYDYGKSIPNLKFIKPSELLEEGFTTHNENIEIKYSLTKQVSIPFLNSKYYINDNILTDNLIIQFSNENSAIIFSNGGYKVVNLSNILPLIPGKTYFINLSSKLDITY